jgi:histidinol-phosphate aminotransferase
VRDVGIAHHLRVTAGDPDETTAFLDAFARLAPTHLSSQTGVTGQTSQTSQEPPA